MNTLPFWDVCVRLVLAMICGGIIGVERGRKHRPAGFRTYILVCVGAALTMVLSSYLVAMYQTFSAIEGNEHLVNGDFSRLGAQVINGIGFLGAGTIIVTGRNQVKGMTTAAGLWASACMGLAIGAGFYFGAVVGCILIILTSTLLSYFEGKIMSTARNMNIYIEFGSTNDIGAIIDTLKKIDVRIFDVEITKIRASDGLPPSAIFSIRLPKKLKHAEVMAVIASVAGIQTVEEL